MKESDCKESVKGRAEAHAFANSCANRFCKMSAEKAFSRQSVKRKCDLNNRFVEFFYFSSCFPRSGI